MSNELGRWDVTILKIRPGAMLSRQLAFYFNFKLVWYTRREKYTAGHCWRRNVRQRLLNGLTRNLTLLTNFEKLPM